MDLVELLTLSLGWSLSFESKLLRGFNSRLMFALILRLEFQVLNAKDSDGLRFLRSQVTS